MDLTKMALPKKESKDRLLATAILSKYCRIVSTAALATIIGACAPQSSDSLKKYSKIKQNMGPIHNTPSPTQSYIPSDLFIIEIDPSTNSNFIVGQRNTLRFRTALNLPGTKYRLVSRDLPRGTEPLRNLGNGIWEMVWTPNPELISTNMNGPVRGGFHVSLDIYEVNSDRSRMLVNGLTTEREFSYSLLRSGVVPEITAIHGVAAYPEVTKLTEGDVLNLVIEVKDPSSTPTQKPRLLPIAVPNRPSKEKTIVSGHAFLFLDSDPTMVKPGVWQFKALFDTKNNSVPEFNIDGQQVLSPNVLADLSLQILSANRTVSPVKNITFEITYRRELVKPAFRANPELQKVTQNSRWSYTFESYLPTMVGSMTTYLADETVKLPNTPKLTCKSSKNSTNQQSCRIDWTVPCSVNTGEMVIKVIGAAEYQGQNTSVELQKKLEILENKKCPAAPKPTSTDSVNTTPTGPSDLMATTPPAIGTTPAAETKPTPTSTHKSVASKKSAHHKSKGVRQ